MIFTRGDVARIQIWPTVVYGFYLALKSVTAAVRVIYDCLLYLCIRLENYHSEITQPAIEHLPVSPLFVLHDYCIGILERTCFIRELCTNHFSNSIVTRRLFNIRLLYFVVFLSHEIKKFPDNDLCANERGYFKNLKTVRRHCLCWLNSSVHSLQSFVLLHVCVHNVQCFIPMTVGGIANIKKTINAFTVKGLESISHSTKSIQFPSENRCSDDGNLRQLTSLNVKSKLINETRFIEFLQDNLTKAIGIVEKTDGFKYVSRNFSFKGNGTKVGPSTSDCYDFNVTKKIEVLPENIFDLNEKCKQIIQDENLSGTSREDFNVKKVSEKSLELIFDENKNNGSESKTQQAGTDEEYFIQGTQIDKLKVDKISEEIPEEIFDNEERNLSYKENCTEVGLSISDYDFFVTKIPKDLPENIFDIEENEKCNQMRIDENLLKGMSKTSIEDFNVGNVSEESPEIILNENKRNCSESKTLQVRPNEEYFIQGKQINKLKIDKISEEIPEEIFDNEDIEQNLRYKENCIEEGLSTSGSYDFVVTKLPKDLPENIFDIEENEKCNRMRIEDENLLKGMSETSIEDFNVGNVSEESPEIILNESKKNCPESKTLQVRPNEEYFIQGTQIDYLSVGKISEEIPDDIFDNEDLIDQGNEAVLVKLHTQVNTIKNYVKEIETKPDHANRIITKQLRGTKPNLKVPVTTANAMKMDDSKNLKLSKEKPSEIGRVLSRHRISYQNFSKNRSLKNYCGVSLKNPPKVQKSGEIISNKIVIDIEDKTAISLLKHSDKACEELTELKLLFYFALKGEVVVLAPIMKWVAFSSKYLMESKQKHKVIFSGWMVGLCIRDFVLDFCDFHFRNIKRKYEVIFYSLRGSKSYAIGFDKIDKLSIEKDNPNSIKYPFEFSKSGYKFFPYYDWELPVEDGNDFDDEELLSSFDPSIPEPELATTACEFTVGFGTLPERLKKMLKIKYPNWSNHSGVVVQFPIMTPQEVAEDKGKQFVFLNWWNHYFSKTAADSKPSIDDAFSSFLKRESGLKMENQMEQNPEQNKNYALHVQPYQQEEFQKALIGEDIKLTQIPDFSSTVEVKGTRSIVPFRNEKFEDGYPKVDVNALVSNFQKIKLRKDESQKSKIAGNAVIENDRNLQKQTEICNKIDYDQSKQNPSENDQENNCNKKKSKSSRKKTGRNKLKKAIDEDVKGQGENTDEVNDNKEDSDLVSKIDNDQQKQKSSITIRQTRVTVDNVMNENIEKVTIDEGIDIKEPNIDRINDVQKQAINNGVNDTTKKLASAIDKRTKKEKSKQKDVPIIKEIKCNQNKNDIKISSDSNSTKKKIDINTAGNSISKSKTPIIPRREKTSVGVSEEIRFDSKSKTSRENTTINSKEIQNSSSDIVNKHNFDDCSQIARSNDASNIFGEHKSTNANKLCLETDTEIEIIPSVPQLNGAIEYKSAANSKPIKSRSSQFTSLLSTASCPDLIMKVHSEVLPQKTNEPVQNKPNTCGNNQTIHQPPLQREASQDVKTNDETMMTFKLYSDVVKQKKSDPVHSPISVVNNQLVNLGISKLPQSKRKIFPTDPSSTASSTCSNAEVALTCTNATATSMTPVDTSTSTTPADTVTSATPIDATSMLPVTKATSTFFDAITSTLCTRPLVPNSDVPSTEIAQEVAPEKPQTKELCGDPPNEQMPKKMPKITSTDCGVNQYVNIPPKVHTNLLMTDSESDSNDSSESSSPVAEYNFSGVRQKLRSDIALKLTDVMRKKVTNNKK